MKQKEIVTTNLASLSELAREMKINKSKLYFYYRKGIFDIDLRAGNIMLFDRDKVKCAVGGVGKVAKAAKIKPTK